MEQMEISITCCDCGNKEQIKSDERLEIYSKNFYVSGGDGGEAYIRCKKCGLIFGF